MPGDGDRWHDTSQDVQTWDNTYNYGTQVVNYYGDDYVTVLLEYRLNGAPAWTEVSRYTVLATDLNDTIASHSIPFYITGLDEDDYDYRVTLESGTGTITLNSALSDAWNNILTISGKTTNTFKKQSKFELPPLVEGFPQSWDIKVTRITADDVAQTNNDIYWDSVSSLTAHKLRYPNSALMGISVDASQFNAIPVRGYKCKLLKVRIPNNYDPIARTYSGAWDGDFYPTTYWSNNPAWCLYDLLIEGRYGLGDYLDASNIDKWTFYEIGKYCDERVPTGYGSEEPRYTCNVYLQTQAEAMRLIQDFASLFSGYLFWSDSQLTAVYDHPSDPVYSFTNANIIDGLFAYTGTALNSRTNMALVSWNDPQDMFKQTVEMVEDVEQIADTGLRQSSIAAFGTTSRGQAHRKGKQIIYTEAEETEIVTFKHGLEGMAIRPGDVIEIFDQFRANIRLGGRIVSGDTTSVVLDTSVTLKANTTYTLSLITPVDTEVTLEDGSPLIKQIPKLETITVTNIPETTDTLTFAAITTPATANSVWGLTETNISDPSLSVNPQLFRVINIIEESPLVYGIVALTYNPGKYATIEEDALLEHRPIRTAASVPRRPDTIEVSEELHKTKKGIFNKIHISWNPKSTDPDTAVPISNTVSFDVYMKRDQLDSAENNGNWELVGTTYGTSTEINDAIPGLYDFRVAGKNVLGATSSFRVYSEEKGSFINIRGKTLPPADVTNFSAAETAQGVVFTWDTVDDIDFSHYEIRDEDANWGDNVANPPIASNVTELEYLIDTPALGDYDYYIKAVDTSGNYSTNADTDSVTVAPPGTVLSFTATEIAGGIQLSWAALADPKLSYYEIREADTDWGNEDTALFSRVTSTLQIIPLRTPSSYPFFIKAYDVDGIASVASATAVAVVANVEQVAGFTAVEGANNTIHLSWTASTSPNFDSYQIREGLDWESPTAILYDRLTDNKIDLPLRTNGTYYFMIKAKGNLGSFSTAVSNESITIGIVDPVENFTATENFDNNTILLEWDHTDDPNHDHFEVRVGNTWDPNNPDNLIADHHHSTSVNIPTYPAGPYKFWIIQEDKAGDQSVPISVSLTIGALDPVVAFTHTESYETIDFKWDLIDNSRFDFFEIKEGPQGDTPGSGRVLVVTDLRSTTYSIRQRVVGTYNFYIRAFDIFGIANTETHRIVTIAQCPDVTGFTATLRATDILLTWDKEAVDVNHSHYRVIKRKLGGVWTEGPLVSNGEAVIVDDYKGNMHVTDLETEGSWDFMIKGYSNVGCSSLLEATATLTIVKPEDVLNFTAVQANDRIELTWTADTNINFYKYEIREGTDWESAVYVTTIDVNSYTIPSGNNITRVFLVKSINSPGIYSENAAAASTAIAKAPNRNILVTVDEVDTKFVANRIYTDDGSVVDETLKLVTRDDVTLDNLYDYGEYVFEVPLGNPYSGRVSLDLDSTAEQVDDRWLDADFTWDSDAALRAWREGGEEDAISVLPQIAVNNTVLQAGIHDEISFHTNATSYNGIAPTGTGSADFSEFGRHRKGMYIVNAVDASYDYSGNGIPTTGDLSFWLKPQVVTVPNCEIFRLINGGDYMQLYHNAGVLSLTVNGGEAINVTMPDGFEQYEHYLIIVSQTADNRYLKVGHLKTGDITESTGAYIPEPTTGNTWTTFNLYVGTTNCDCVISDLKFHTTAIADAQEELRNSRPAGYSSFVRFLTGDYSFTDAIVKIAMISNDYINYPELNTLTVEVDVPDIIQSERNISIIAGDYPTGKLITFTNAFSTGSVPDVVVAWQYSASGFGNATYDSVTNTGFRAYVVDSSNAKIAGTISYSARGY